MSCMWCEAQTDKVMNKFQEIVRRQIATYQITMILKYKKKLF